MLRRTAVRCSVLQDLEKQFKNVLQAPEARPQAVLDLLKETHSNPRTEKAAHLAAVRVLVRRVDGLPTARLVLQRMGARSLEVESKDLAEVLAAVGRSPLRGAEKLGVLQDVLTQLNTAELDLESSALEALLFALISVGENDVIRPLAAALVCNRIERGDASDLMLTALMRLSASTTGAVHYYNQLRNKYPSRKGTLTGTCLALGDTELARATWQSIPEDARADAAIGYVVGMRTLADAQYLLDDLERCIPKRVVGPQNLFRALHLLQRAAPQLEGAQGCGEAQEMLAKRVQLLAQRVGAEGVFRGGYRASGKKVVLRRRLGPHRGAEPAGASLGEARDNLRVKKRVAEAVRAKAAQA